MLYIIIKYYKVFLISVVTQIYSRELLKALQSLILMKITSSVLRLAASSTLNQSGAPEGADVGLTDVEVIGRTVVGLPDRLADEQTHGFSVVLRRETEVLVNDWMKFSNGSWRTHLSHLIQLIRDSKT